MQEDLFQEPSKANSLENKVSETPVSPQIPKREYIPHRDFYVPGKRYELVDWLYKYCERTGKAKRDFGSMHKKQLYAIYYSIRKKSG
jgi:hypothetical protein